SPNELLPPAGVYATTIVIDGLVLPSITNVGFRPTFGDVDRLMLETHIFDLDRDLYGQTLRLSFVQRLRDERTFPDVDALRTQIDADCRSPPRLFVRISLSKLRMSEPSGTEDESTLVLRISIPAGAEYRAIVPEMAAKVAAYLGDSDGEGADAAAALGALAAKVTAGGEG